MPRVGSEAMNLPLDAVSRMVHPGAHAVLACDGARGAPGRCQTGGRLRVADNIALLAPPSRSAQRNPAENVRACLRGNPLNRRIRNSRGEIAGTCCTA